MARIRSIKPEFPQSESMGRVSRDARLLFVLLWTIADDHGRARAHSRMLASLLFPYDDDAGKLIDGWLGELEKEGCIRLYETGGSRYLIILGWGKHQKIDRPSKPQFPEPDNSTREASRESIEDSENHMLGREGKGREGNREESKEPRAKRAKPSLKTSLPNDFGISERVAMWAKTKGFTRLDEYLEVFRSKAVAKGYTYADWDEGFMGCIREDWPGFRKSNGATTAMQAGTPRQRRELGT